jgi:alcohol dehydrogenase
VAAKRELALELGATHAVDPTAGGGTVEQVREARPRWGAPRLRSGRVRGGARRRLVGHGPWRDHRRDRAPPPSQELRISAAQLVGEARTLVGSYLGGAVPERDLPRLLALWRAGRLPVERLHSTSLPLDDVNAAMDALADGQTVRQVLLPHG